MRVLDQIINDDLEVDELEELEERRGKKAIGQKLEILTKSIAFPETFC